MLGPLMQRAAAIPDRWSIRRLTWRRAIRCFTSDRFMAQIISGSFWRLSMPWLSAGNRVCTTRPYTATPITPSSGFRSVSARPNLSVRPRRRSSIRLFCELSSGSIRITSGIRLSSGRRRSGVRYPRTSAGNKTTTDYTD